MSADIKLTRLAECAGCGAKVGAGVLAQLLDGLPTRTDERLLVGYDTSDDASVYRLSDQLALVQTVDFFPPIVDDPFRFGQIAAANAFSDVYAMGGEPKLALNLLCVSPEMDDEAVRAVLRGGYDKAYEAGAIITGGHTIRDLEPKYGLAEPSLLRLAEEQMAMLNRAARDILTDFPVESCTDVTGFGLLGHTLEMAKGGGVTAVLDSRRIPLLPGVLELALMGFLPEGMYRNRRFAEPYTRADDGVSRALLDLLYDPQTSGGLLISVPEKSAPPLLRALRDHLPCAEEIGHVEPKQGDTFLWVR